MATETLGQRILDAAEAYANSVQEAIQFWGSGEWTSHHNEATAEELDRLCALCDHATAAENLAVATVRRDNAKDAWVGGEDAAAIMETFPVYEMELAKYKTALRAWRAIMVGRVAP